MFYCVSFNNLTNISLLTKVIWLIFQSTVVNSSIPKETVRNSEILTRETIETSDLYKISYFKLKSLTKSCLVNNQRAFADCVYNSDTKWRQLTTANQVNDEIKLSCCSFWESDQCINQLILDMCPKDQSTRYINDEDLILARQFIREGYCSSYQQLTDCIYLMSFWMVTVVSLIVTLITIIVIIILIVYYYYRRRKSFILLNHNQTKLPQQLTKLTSLP